MATKVPSSEYFLPFFHQIGQNFIAIFQPPDMVVCVKFMFDLRANYFIETNYFVKKLVSLTFFKERVEKG